MSASQDEKGFLGNPTVRVVGSLVLLALALGYGWTVFSKYHRGLPPKPFQPLTAPPPSQMTGAAGTKLPDFRAAMPSVEERRKIMENLMGKVDATADQRKKIEEIWITGFQNPDNFLERVHESTKVLTPQQLQAIQPFFVNVVLSRVAKVRRVMKPQDFVSLSQRLVTVLSPPPGGMAGAAAPAGQAGQGQPGAKGQPAPVGRK